MTQPIDDLMQVAREAGYFLYDLTETHGGRTVETDEVDEWAQLERFAQRVATKAVEAEREACALKCEELGANWIHGLRVREQACADAIRARGNT